VRSVWDDQRGGLQACTAAISALRRKQYWSEAVAALDNAQRLGLQPNPFTYGAVISCLDRARQWEQALHVLLFQVLGASIEASVILYNSAISACDKGEHWEYSTALLHDLRWRGLKPDVITWNTLTSASGKREHWKCVLNLLAEMQNGAVQPDAVTSVAAVSACEKTRQWEQALIMLRWSQAASLEPGANTFHAAIAACEKGESWEHALAALAHMEARSLKPDPIAYGTVTSICERCRAIGPSIRLAMDIAYGGQPRSGAGSSACSPVVDRPTCLPHFRHVSVMLEEVVEAFASAGLSEGAVILDCTLGSGGHSEALLQSLPGCRVVALDRDPAALEAARGRLAHVGPGRFEALHGDFGQAAALLARSGAQPRLGGILADLGVSSPQLELPERGFSFRAEGPLDMRMDPSDPATKPATWYLANLGVAELAGYISKYGEEEHAELIAERLIAEQPQTTVAAAKLIERLVAPAGADGTSQTRSVHPATKTFQALRILVNGELDSLARLLGDSARLLAPGGLLCVISFHSLEDNLVRRYIRGEEPMEGAPSFPPPLVSAGGREGLRPAAGELARNPRSRSARLRLAVRRA